MVEKYQRNDIIFEKHIKIKFCFHEEFEFDDSIIFTSAIGDSNKAKIRVAEYSTILIQQGQLLSRVRPTKFKANIIAKIEQY